MTQPHWQSEYPQQPNYVPPVQPMPGRPMAPQVYSEPYPAPVNHPTQWTQRPQDRPQWPDAPYPPQQGPQRPMPYTGPRYAKTTMVHWPHVILDICTVGLWAPVHFTIWLVTSRKTRIR